MKRMKSELLSINTALAHIDLSQKVVEDSKKIRKSTDEIGDSFREYADSYFVFRSLKQPKPTRNNQT